MTNQKRHENKPPLEMGRELRKYQNTEMQKRYLVVENDLFKAAAEAERAFTKK